MINVYQGAITVMGRYTVSEKEQIESRAELTQEGGGSAGLAARHLDQVHDEEGRPAHDEGGENL